jgi:hypothetical protein
VEPVLAFVTLFLGLTFGPQTIELRATDQVARIELSRDGEVFENLREPPWKVVRDFGQSPLPTVLQARAFDAEGNELGRVEQWINLPRSAAEIDVILQGDGGQQQALLTWRSLTGGSPIAVRASLDDQPLEVTDFTVLDLPATNPQQVHLLRVEADFDQQVLASTEVTFGGTYLDQVQSELTALPLALAASNSTAADLQGRVTADGAVVRVAAVERGMIDLVLVRDAAAVEPLRELLSREARVMKHGNKSLTSLSTQGRLQRLLPLEARARLTFVWPGVDRLDQASDFDLFPHSQELDNGQGGLAWLVPLMTAPATLSQDQRLADAIAIAGMHAVRRNRRRAVVLVLGPQRDRGEASRLQPAAVLEYLAAVHVPLFVWSIDDRPPESWVRAGAQIHKISTLTRWRRALAALWDEVDQQHIVWLEGRHLPQSITLHSESPERPPLQQPEILR